MSTNSRTLVILGTRKDPHVDRVATEMVRRNNSTVYVLDYKSKCRFSLEVDRIGDLYLKIDGDRLRDNYLVWDRRKLFPGTSFYIEGDNPSKELVAQEWSALYTLLDGLNNGRVINSIRSKSCRIKPYQQIVAARAGFLVPSTLITNSKAELIRFYDESGKVIMKSLSGRSFGGVKEGGGSQFIMTMRLSTDDINSASEAELSYCPHFFQEEVVKKYELRIIVVDTAIFAFCINPHSHALAEVDWRKAMRFIEFSPIKLDGAIKEKIRLFMKDMDLVTGSLDIIIDTNDRAWFLECNQDGAWAWFDNILNGKITRAFVDAFCSRLDVNLKGCHTIT